MSSLFIKGHVFHADKTKAHGGATGRFVRVWGYYVSMGSIGLKEYRSQIFLQNG